VRLGAVFPHAQFQTVDPDAVVHLVQRREDAGYDHLLVYDHVLGADTSNRPNWTGYYSSADPFLEPLVLLAYIARSCSLELVTDVLVLPQRQSALVAKQVATLALLAPGRIRLGVGIGWNEVEYEALGMDLHSRAARMEEQIWLEAAGHREGHIALRYQLSEGNLPIPATRVVSVGEVASLTGLPAVSPAERAAARRDQTASFATRFLRRPR